MPIYMPTKMKIVLSLTCGLLWLSGTAAPTARGEEPAGFEECAETDAATGEPTAKVPGRPDAAEVLRYPDDRLDPRGTGLPYTPWSLHGWIFRRYAGQIEMQEKIPYPRSYYGNYYFRGWKPDWVYPLPPAPVREPVDLNPIGPDGPGVDFEGRRNKGDQRSMRR